MNALAQKDSDSGVSPGCCEMHGRDTRATITVLVWGAKERAFIRQMLSPSDGKREQPGRRELARQRAELARRELANCRFCAHDCQVDRSQVAAGICHAGPEPCLHSAQIDMADELELVPVYAVALSGCDMRCAYCITGAQSWNARAGVAMSAVELAGRARRALDDGARTVMILGGEPTIHLPYVLDVVAELPETARLAFKTNAHASASGRALLHGMFDLWCVDYKFGNDACAERVAQVPDYTRVVRENLVWAAGQGDLIVRHLLMPEHVECCWRPVAEWLAAELPAVKVGLRTGFWPAWQSRRHADLRRTVTPTEIQQAQAIAAEYALRLVE